MRAYAIIKMTPGGEPDVDFFTNPITGWTLAAHIGHEWGCYLLVGTTDQLTVINGLPGVFMICTDETVYAPVPEAVRTKINTWLTARGMPTVTVGTTCEEAIRNIFRLCNQHYQHDQVYIKDV